MPLRKCGEESGIIDVKCGRVERSHNTLLLIDIDALLYANGYIYESVQGSRYADKGNAATKDRRDESSDT